MMKELGISSSAENVAEHYSAFIDGFVIDEADKESAKSIKIPTISTNTVMLTLSDSISGRELFGLFGGFPLDRDLQKKRLQLSQAKKGA